MLASINVANDTRRTVNDMLGRMMSSSRKWIDFGALPVTARDLICTDYARRKWEKKFTKNRSSPYVIFPLHEIMFASSIERLRLLPFRSASYELTAIFTRARDRNTPSDFLSTKHTTRRDVYGKINGCSNDRRRFQSTTVRNGRSRENIGVTFGGSEGGKGIAMASSCTRNPLRRRRELSPSSSLR